MKNFVLVIIAATGVAAPALARPYETVMQEAKAAFASDDFATAGARLDEAQILRPYSLYLTRNRVLTRILTGRMDDAISLAKDIADRGLVFETPPNEAFDRMRASPAFAPVAAQMAENAKPIGVTTPVLEIAEEGLLPEAISIGAKHEVLIGSVRTGAVVAIGDDHTMRAVAAAQGGVFDLEARGNLIWAAVNNQLAYENAGNEPSFAAVMAFDRKSGAPSREIKVSEGGALLGDLEVSRKGEIFASDSLTPRIFRMAPKGETLDVFAEDARFANLQGIALDEKNHRLFVADYLAGLFAVDLKSGAVTAVANPAKAHLGGIDGLYLYRGDLIGIQNGASPQRIVRIALSDDGATAEGITVLQQALEEWSEPTHGVVVGTEFHYIATSNWPAYDDEGNLREGAARKPLKVMAVRLD